MNLIPEWRHAWRLSSLQVAVLATAINAAAGAWSFFDGHIDPVLFASVNMGLSVAVAVARLVTQPKVREITAREQLDGR
jgi:hypothetical protein